MIYILEDNDQRVQQFRTAAAAIAPHLAVRFWRSAHEMIADLADGLKHASIIECVPHVRRIVNGKYSAE